MDREKKVEVVNICIVNALRIDEEHRMMILEKLIQSVSDENKEKILRLLGDVGQSDQLKCPECKLDYDKEEIEMFRGLCESCRDRVF